MNKIVKWIQKHQDVFLKISKNNYLMAIKDGFISIMPLVMFSSLMILIVQLPTLFGIVIPANAKLIMVNLQFNNGNYGANGRWHDSESPNW